MTTVVTPNPSPDAPSDATSYKVGLSPVREAVISSHFMHELCRDPGVALYDRALLCARSVPLSRGALEDRLLPVLTSAAEGFARSRAEVARRRAFERLGGRAGARAEGVEAITEVLFDREFRRGSRASYPREALREKVAARVAAGAPIEMVVPALPFKICCPLKSRGPCPDLAEVNFLLGLYEVARSIENVYGDVRPELAGPLATFTVVSDGNRFNRLVREPDAAVETYRAALGGWIEALRLRGRVLVVDYLGLLSDRLRPAMLDSKRRQHERAVRQYATTMWPIFDPNDMTTTLRTAARIDPDPEESNREGRFVSLVKSLVYTMRYACLERLSGEPAEGRTALYRELTGHIFEPFAELEPSRPPDAEILGVEFPTSRVAKERLRQAMLREVWAAAIGYVAEIKSDRELERDPITTCLPNHLRWTIHAKPGQLGLLGTASVGLSVQAWAGTAVFKLDGRGAIKLCTLPVLALEGAGAVPVHLAEEDATGQPLFYIHPDVPFSDIEQFLTGLPGRLTRRRTG